MQNDYLKRIRNIFIAILLIAVVLVIIDYNFFLEYDVHVNKPLNIIDKAIKQANINLNVNDNLIRNYFIVYDEDNERSVELAKNIEATLQPMKQAYRVVSVSQLNQNEIRTTDTVMLALTRWEPYANTINKLLLKVSEGTCLFVAYVPMQDPIFISCSQKFGVFEIGTDIISDSMSFVGNTIVGITNDTVQTIALETSLSTLHLVKDATVFIEGENNIPQYYTYRYGAGNIGVYTADNLSDKLQRGLIAGMLGALEDELVYPIIQTGVFFIDDFPSPMGGYNKKVKEEYGMDVESFIRNVWWPDVLALGKQYGIVYTGAVITSYNDVINSPFPEKDGLDVNMIYYYGKELLRAGGEICWHGYNHQPLKFDSYIDPVLAGEYHAWPSAGLAESAINVGMNKFKQAFPNYQLHGYVPPSNVITPEGQKVLEKVLEESLIVCGLYISDAPDIPAFDYKEENGTIFFPRVECDSFLTDLVKYSTSSVITHVGVFSHFIHPDDVLDDERSHKYKWHEMRLHYEELLEFIANKFYFLRMETVTEAGQHVVEWDKMQMETNYYADHIDVWVSNTSEPYYLMLRTNKKIVPSQDYTYEQIDETAYLITAQVNYLNIQLKERD